MVLQQQHDIITFLKTWSFTWENPGGQSQMRENCLNEDVNNLFNLNLSYSIEFEL